MSRGEGKDKKQTSKTKKKRKKEKEKPWLKQQWKKTNNNKAICIQIVLLRLLILS
jgi:hypothetical protein